RALVERAVALGHRRLGYAGTGAGAESYADRLRGFREAAGTLGVTGVHLPDWTGLFEAGVTAVFAEELADAVAIVRAAEERGLSVPRDLSVVELGASSRPVHTDIDFAGLRIPRREMGRRAVELLMGLLENGGTPQELLVCEPVEGSTLAPAPAQERSQDQHDQHDQEER
ncbi:substrate-binding domain-containing protein, partial [Nonomuraea lactucae]|uniref:substrate-binding domain-containing protein n=1 Tax=Nonomuraea lactucae TaxID=2249762 RepID=UPI0013B41EE1